MSPSLTPHLTFWDRISKQTWMFWFAWLPTTNRSRYCSTQPFSCTCSCCCFFFFFTGVLWHALSLSGSCVTFTDGTILMPRLCGYLSSLSLIILGLSGLLTTPWQPSGVSDIWSKTSRIWKYGPSFCSHGFTMRVFCAPLRQLPCCLLIDSRWQAAHC